MEVHAIASQALVCVLPVTAVPPVKTDVHLALTALTVSTLVYVNMVPAVIMKPVPVFVHQDLVAPTASRLVVEIDMVPDVCCNASANMEGTVTPSAVPASAQLDGEVFTVKSVASKDSGEGTVNKYVTVNMVVTAIKKLENVTVSSVSQETNASLFVQLVSGVRNAMNAAHAVQMNLVIT